MSMAVNRSIICLMVSLIFSGRIASASISFLMIGMSFFFVCVRQKAEVSDFHQALWQDMKQKSANELIGIQGDFFDFIVSLPVPVSESNPTVINGNDPVI